MALHSQLKGRSRATRMLKYLGRLDQRMLDPPIGSPLSEMDSKRTWRGQFLAHADHQRTRLFQKIFFPRCPECGVEKTVEHVFFDCSCCIRPKQRILREIRTTKIFERKLQEDAQLWRGKSSFAVTIAAHFAAWTDPGGSWAPSTHNGRTSGNGVNSRQSLAIRSKALRLYCRKPRQNVENVNFKLSLSFS